MRPRLWRALDATPATLVAVVVAPSGYGKTTFLAQWARQDPRPHARLALGPEHAAPLRLLDAIERHLRPLRGAGTPVSLVLDHAEVLDRRSAEPLLSVAEALPHGSVLTIASTVQPPLPIGRLRLEGRLRELRTAELAMTMTEGQQLLQSAGVLLDADGLCTVMRLTEGWPAGLALAALALRDAEERPVALAAFGGNDHVVADYLHDVFLQALAPDDLDLLVRTSVLETLSGPLCDAVTGRQGSGRVLRELSRSNIPLERLDRCDETFRVHPLLRGMLRSELSRSGRALERRAHLRAASWLEDQGATALAAEQAARGGDAARAGRLLWAEAEAAVVQGRGEVLERALQGFTTGQVEADPALALSRAAGGLERAHREDVEHWIVVGERALAGTASDQAARFATGLAVLRAVVARDGVAAMGAHARRARELGPAPGGWHGLACFLDGASKHLLGDEQLAWDRLSESARTRAVGAPLVAMLSHALLGLIDLMAERWDAGRREAAHARACALEHGVDTHPAAALVFAASAFALAHHGELKQARRDATQARRLARLPSAFGPWLAAEVHVALARAELRLSDSAAARDLLSGAGRLIRRCPEATAVRAAIDDAWDRVDRFAASAVVGTTTLTTAELRVLRMLPSHLSLGEIAARLHVSPNTVKTQAHAVYRKLGASSRSEAVACARTVGLIDP